MAKDYYNILNISKNASDAEIKKAYKKFARKYHPDLNPNDKVAEDKFKDISEAYAVLGDKEKRKAYDQLGPDGFRQYGQAGGNYQGPFSRKSRSGGSIFDDIGFDFSDIFSNIKSDQRSSHGAYQEGPSKGQDIQYTMELSFLDALKGLATTISYERLISCKYCSGTGHDKRSKPVVCPDCNGKGKITIGPGFLNIPQKCSRCNGRGKIYTANCSKCRGKQFLPSKETIKVQIPPGVGNGSKIRVEAKGNAGQNGGPYGDLFIITKVQDHPYFERKGSNIYTELPITIKEAILGAKVQAPTVDGLTMLRIPPGTNSGQVLRLRNKGVPGQKGVQRGDHFVKVKIVVPKSIDLDSQKLIEEFEKRNFYNPREEIVKYG